MNKSIRVIRAIQLAITDHEFISSHRRHPTAFTRNRKLPFATVVSTILQLAKKSLQIECNLLGDNLMHEPASKQAFSKARYKISYMGFKALNDLLLEEAYQEDNIGLWHGYRVFGTDGSTIRLPESEELETYFERWDRGADRNDNSPLIARISEIVELTSGIIVSAEIAPRSFGERRLATEQIQEVARFFQHLEQSKQLFVFDRGYISHDLLKLIFETGVDFMFRVPRGFNKIIDCQICSGKSDSLIKPFADLPSFRLVVKNLPSGERCVLLTSITDTDNVPNEDLFGLYWMRWIGCEEGYKKQKVALELENFSGIGFEAILQEFWATVVMINLFQLQCLEEEGPWDPRNPPKERINRNVVFGSLRNALLLTMLGEISAEELTKKFQSIARRSKIKIRPGRVYSRAKVDKPKRHHVFRRVC